MAHHAYYAAGTTEEGLAASRAYAEHILGLSGSDNPDVIVLSYGLFSVDDARKLADTAYRSSSSGKKVIIASMTRVFHEAQNALLKVLEEPPEGVTIVLVVPSEGLFIPTLRSRLLPLPGDADGNAGTRGAEGGIAQQFLLAAPPEREKLIAKLIERAKSDKDETKQGARQEAIELVNGLTSAAHMRFETAENAAERAELRLFLEDLSSFTPILYERSAPLKLIFEHLLLVIPKGQGNREV